MFILSILRYVIILANVDSTLSLISIMHIASCSRRSHCFAPSAISFSVSGSCKFPTKRPISQIVSNIVRCKVASVSRQCIDKQLELSDCNSCASPGEYLAYKLMSIQVVRRVMHSPVCYFVLHGFGESVRVGQWALLLTGFIATLLVAQQRQQDSFQYLVRDPLFVPLSNINCISIFEKTSRIC